MCDTRSVEKLKAYHRLKEIPTPTVFDLSNLFDDGDINKKIIQKINKSNSLLVIRINSKDDIKSTRDYFKKIFDNQTMEYNKSLRQIYSREKYKEEKLPLIDVGCFNLLFVHSFDNIKLVEPIGYHKEQFRLTYCHTGKHFFKSLRIGTPFEKERSVFEELCWGHHDMENVYTDIHDIKDAVQILIDINDNNSSEDL